MTRQRKPCGTQVSVNPAASAEPVVESSLTERLAPFVGEERQRLGCIRQMNVKDKILGRVLIKRRSQRRALERAFICWNAVSPLER
jgi:hypothetical protein